jgi:hypothetical protein
MAKPAISLAHKFIGHLNYLEKTRAKMEKLLTTGAIVRSDIEQVYAGLYLEAITSLERLIENLFIGLLVGRIAPSSSEIVPRVSFKSDHTTPLPPFIKGDSPRCCIWRSELCRLVSIPLHRTTSKGVFSQGISIRMFGQNGQGAN